MADVGQVLRALLEESHLLAAEGLPSALRRHSRELGALDAAIYLVDYDQAFLRPLDRLSSFDSEPFAVEGTVGGRAYTSGEGLVGHHDGKELLWLPILDGTDRLGVASYLFETVTEQNWSVAVSLTSLVAELVVSKSQHSDFFFLARRRKNMEMAAEMQWGLLPPLSHATSHATIAGAMEPAYHVGGDAFDYAMNYHTLHFALVDAMGHGLGASVMASAAIGSLRHSRRSGRVLTDAYSDLDSVISQQFDADNFVTAQFGQLDCETGRLLWLNAGHPCPLLMREGRVIEQLACPPTLPAGFGNGIAAVGLGDNVLQPGDRIFFYTDGITEARAEQEQFGIERLIDFLVRESATGLRPSEVVRRLARAVLNHHHGVLQDDATMLMLEWPGSGES